MTDDALSPRKRGMTAWEAATCGAPRRLVDVYTRTMERARERGIITDRVTCTLADHGVSMTVLWVKYDDRPPAVFDVSYIFTPGRDQKFGFFVAPPGIFKRNLRLTAVPRNGETKQ